MRTLLPFESERDSLIATFARRMSESAALRRAELNAEAARAEAELTIKARSEFLANMNHELRTPLNAIIGFATMLRDGEAYALGEDQRRSYAEYVLQSADLLLDHINTLLETAVLDSGEMKMEEAPVDFVALLDEAVSRSVVATAAAKVTIDVKSSGGPVLGWGDAERIGQAVDHLLRTAIKLSPEGGRVLARAVVDDNGWAEIAIRDRSPGLAPEDISKALTAFREANRGLDRSFAGPGVGLAIAKTFIEMQGGRFSIKSRPGEGTLVRISTPPPAAHDQAADADVRIAS